MPLGGGIHLLLEHPLIDGRDRPLRPAVHARLHVLRGSERVLGDRGLSSERSKCSSERSSPSSSGSSTRSACSSSSWPVSSPCRTTIRSFSLTASTLPMRAQR